MKDYTSFEAVDFARDEEFIAWVKEEGVDPLWDNAWRKWLRANPHKVEAVEEARAMIRAVLEERQYIPNEQKQNDIWARIDERVSSMEVNAHLRQVARPTRKRVFLPASFYKAAATILVIALVGAALVVVFWDGFFLHASTERDTFSYVDDEFMEYRNEGSKPHVVILEDGSQVTLQPNSFIQYPEHFTEQKRDVYLTGEAFFEVARDTQKPFSVHTSELVTQVLGTSFTIRAYKEEKNIRVSVKTGKVSVFTQNAKKTNHNGKSSGLEGAVLTPNQQVIFSKKGARLVKSLVDNPAVLPETISGRNFQFVDSPIKDVFNLLEKAYGVEIVYDEELLSNCYLNASLDSLSFYDQLMLISKGINAEYEILDAHVIISGNGCQ